MPAGGIYLTLDEGKSWRHAQAVGLVGEIHGLAAHPGDPGIVAAASASGLYLSRDAGRSFRRLDARGPVTAVAFDLDGKRVRYARALASQTARGRADGRNRRALRLPKLEGDYVTCLAQSPVDAQARAFATRRRGRSRRAGARCTSAPTAARAGAGYRPSKPGSAQTTNVVHRGDHAMKHWVGVLAAAALAFGSAPMASAQMKHGDMKGMDHGQSEKSQTHKGTGVVTNVDRNAGKVTLKHEAIQSLNWPGMTMAFTVKDKALLDKVAKDKKVDFEFVQEGRQYVITAIK